jgi:Lrp/AsnC family leucine-responsive transcriptional regulator
MSEIDEKDWRLIRELREDARAPLARLSHRLGIPRVTLLDRLRALRERGVIRRFTVQLDPGLLGLGTLAFVLVRFERGGGVTQRRLAERIGQMPGVEEVHIIAGEWDLLLKVRGPSLEALGELVVDRLRDSPGIAATMTLPSFVTVKEG